MAQNDKPVIVTLSCEAHPSKEDVEIERDLWESWTPEQRLRQCDEMLSDHMANAGGGGWWIDDETDAASMGNPGHATPDPLRELAEWLATNARELADLNHADAVLDEAISRAEQALGRKEG